jgi:steroid delta-isomerase-like uncharacterized protein
MRDACLDLRKEVTTMLELVKKHLAAFAAADWDAWRRDLAPESVFVEVPTGRREEGPDAITNLVARWKTAFPDAKAVITHAYEFGDTTVTELEWVATHEGPLETPFGMLPATNRAARVSAVLISRAKNDKIVETRHYFDLMSLFSQLGIIAGIGPQTPITSTQAARA